MKKLLISLLCFVFISINIYPMHVLAFLDGQKIFVQFPSEENKKETLISHWEGRIITSSGIDHVVYRNVIQNFSRTDQPFNPGYVLWKLNEVPGLISSIAKADGQDAHIAGFIQHFNEVYASGNINQYRIDGETWINGGDVFEHMGAESVGFSVNGKWSKFKMSKPPEIKEILVNEGSDVTVGQEAKVSYTFDVHGFNYLGATDWIYVDGQSVADHWVNASEPSDTITQSVTIPSRYLTEGTHIIKVDVKDTYGRKVSKYGSFKVVAAATEQPPLDLNVPTIILTVNPPSIFYGDSFTLNVKKNIPAGDSEVNTTIKIANPTNPSEYKTYDLTGKNSLEITDGSYPKFFSDAGESYPIEAILTTVKGKDTDMGAITISELVAQVNAVLDISAPYETLYYTEEQLATDHITDARVWWDAEDSTSTNGIDWYFFYKDGQLVESQKFDGLYSEVIPISPSNPTVNGSVKVFDQVTGDKAIASDSLTFQFELAPKPVAKIQGPTTIYIGQEVTIEDRSVIPNVKGQQQIVKREWNVNPNDTFTGEFTSTVNKITPTAEGLIAMDLYIEDNLGQSDRTTHELLVLEDLPIPIVSLGGTKKVNRKVIFDASESYGPVSPVDFTKSEWAFIPLEGQSQSSIMVKTISPSQKEVLFKEEGQYAMRFKAYNENGKASNWYELIYTIVPDEKPVADFRTLNQIRRDPKNKGLATIQLTDNSFSNDQDHIAARFWKYRFDSDNDGDFTDESFTLINQGNLTNVSFTVDHVGKYEIWLEVVEGFGQPTIPEFINPSDYQRNDTTNKPLEQRIVEVINTPPTVRWGS